MHFWEILCLFSKKPEESSPTAQGYKTDLRAPNILVIPCCCRHTLLLSAKGLLHISLWATLELLSTGVRSLRLDDCTWIPDSPCWDFFTPFKIWIMEPKSRTQGLGWNKCIHVSVTMYVCVLCCVVWISVVSSGFEKKKWLCHSSCGHVALNSQAKKGVLPGAWQRSAAGAREASPLGFRLMCVCVCMCVCWRIGVVGVVSVSGWPFGLCEPSINQPRWWLLTFLLGSPPPSYSSSLLLSCWWIIVVIIIVIPWLQAAFSTNCKNNLRI